MISGPIIPNLAAIVAARLARGWRGRLIISHHHPVRLARGQSWKNSVPLVRLLYRFADASFAVSPAVRDEVIEVAGLDPARVGCIPNVLPPLPPLADGCPHPGSPRGAGAARCSSPSAASSRSRTCRCCSRPSTVAEPLDALLLIAGSGSQEALLRARVEALNSPSGCGCSAT